MSEMMNIQQEQINKWNRMGHEPVWERGSVRLREFKKNLPRDLEVTVLNQKTGQYAPLMLTCGRPLKCGEVLPERADLALDDEGHLISQAEFEQRYDRYLSAFVYPAGTDIAFEPVPNVVNYVKETTDTWSESKGMVEIGFDPKLGEEFKPKARFGPNGETEEEWLKDSQKNAHDMTSALNKMADLQAQLTAFLMAKEGVSIPVQTVAEPAPVGVTHAEAVEAAGEPEKETAPCGKRISKGYLAQHQRHCDHDDCGGKGVNTYGRHVKDAEE